MRQTGLKNRFPKAVSEWWEASGWYECLICRQNGFDCLHHILSESTKYFIPGKHNKSILNSCPLHNDKCHLYNGAVLHTRKMISKLLKEVEWILMREGYQFTKLDKEFKEVYNKLYE
jgi:hypothetical protein